MIQFLLQTLIPANANSNGSSIIVSFSMLALLLTLVSIDSSNLKSLGYKVPIWMGVLLMPLYLFRRSKETRQSQAGFIVWLVSFGVIFILTIAGGAGSLGHSASYESGRQAGAAAAADKFNNLFGGIEDSCAYKAPYYTYTNYNEFIQGCVDEYNAETNG